MTGARAVARADLADVEARLERERRRYQRHVLWAVAGWAPTAFVPLVFVLTEWGGSALVALVLTVTLVEGWRAFGSKRRIRELETLAMEMRERLEVAAEVPAE
jgi:hypothetical protein